MLTLTRQKDQSLECEYLVDGELRDFLVSITEIGGGCVTVLISTSNQRVFDNDGSGPELPRSERHYKDLKKDQSFTVVDFRDPQSKFCFTVVKVTGTSRCLIGCAPASDRMLVVRSEMSDAGKMALRQRVLVGNAESPGQSSQQQTVPTPNMG